MISNYLYILDFTSLRLVEIELTEEDEKLSSVDLLDKYGFSEDQCNYMYSSEKLELEHINNN